jgi:alpha-ketoglutarate-dependent 2,4-dichlorophenoxyacetate dioxygenase
VDVPELADCDLRVVDDAGLRRFLDAMARQAVCVVRHDRPLTNEEHMAFSARLGPIERLMTVNETQPRISYPEIIDQSNLDEKGEILPDDDKRLAYKRANRLWHTDMSFHRVRATFSLLSAHEVPPAGPATEFADMRAAYDALPQTTKDRIDALSAEHDYYYSRVAGGGPEPTAEERRSRPPARHRLVHVHAPSGRKALYLASHASRVVGLPVDEGRALLGELMAFATQPEFVLTHSWRVGDVLIWDNLATMHRAMPFDDQRTRRDVRRTTVREGTQQLEAVL